MRFSPGGMWGRANYFAVNSSYSNDYRHDCGGGQYQMFNAIVIEGKSAKLQSNNQLYMPPLLPGSNVDRFDSVLGNTNGSDVIMVYSNKKAYPFYLITYKGV